MNKSAINYVFSSGDMNFLGKDAEVRRFFPIIAGQLKHTRLAGLVIRTSPHCPEFVQTISMRECGCSSQALTAMNDYLLQAFGRRREALVLSGNMIIMHPNTMRYLRMRATMETMKEEVDAPAYSL